MIKIFSIGDVVGRAGRRCLQEILPTVRQELNPDVVICNGENAAGGFGLTKKIFKQFTEKFGIDCVTTGNHWLDKRDILDLVGNTPNLLLPANMFNVDDPKLGLSILTSQSGVRYAVMNIYGQVYMYGDNRCPFATFDELVKVIPDSVKVIIVDIHAEVTSEKQALGHYMTGRASLVYGTHTHCPTADERILGDHTGFATDLGMTGPYNTVIGIKKEAAIRRFLTNERTGFEPGKDDLWLCGVLATIDESTGKCVEISRHRYKLKDM